MSLAGGDLTTLSAAQGYLTNAPSPAVISGLISRLSRWVLGEMNRPSILPKTYTTYLSGSGNSNLVLPNWPVLSVSGLYVDGAAIDQSAPSADNQFFDPSGWTFQAWNGIPPGEPAILGLAGDRFWRGFGRNVYVSYLAGYQVSSESATVPASPGPYTVFPIQPYGNWATDQGVTYSDGTALEAITFGSVPTEGQYIPPAPDAANSRGFYTFSSGDAEAQVLLTYGFVPSDLEQVVLEAIAERAAYRSRPGVRSQSLASQESISYFDVMTSQFARSVIEIYKSVLPPSLGPLL